MEAINLDDVPLIMGKGLTKTFDVGSGIFSRRKLEVKAVNDVDIVIYPGEVVGLVGESGCGKTTLGRLILGLVKATSGDLYFKPSEETVESVLSEEDGNIGKNQKNSVFRMSKGKQRELRKHLQIVFQDPYSSLDPRFLVKDIIAEPLDSFGWKTKEAYRRAEDLLTKVGLGKEFMNKYPHEISGGQRQRVSVARALALNPEFIVLDEPTSALDVSVQAQVLNLFEDLRKEFKLTMLFISHHILVVRHLADKIMVMYLGKIVEIGRTVDIMKKPLHPYTQALLSSVPIPDPKVQRDRTKIEGEVPSPINPPKGCSFHPRCKYAFEKCGWTSNELVEKLRLVLSPKRNSELGDIELEKIIVENETELTLHFNRLNDLDPIERVIEKEKTTSDMRAFYGIKSITRSSNNLDVKLYEPEQVKFREVETGHLVSCYLF